MAILGRLELMLAEAEAVATGAVAAAGAATGAAVVVAENSSEIERCPCGQALHYRNPVSQRMIEGFVTTLGATVIVEASGGSWAVPRHYIALHGLSAAELPELAARYGWEKVPTVLHQWRH